MQDFKPADLFLTVISFFGTLLPGALFALLLALNFSFQPLNQRCVEAASWWHHFTGAAQWGLFLVAAYTLGHLLTAVTYWFPDAARWPTKELIKRSPFGIVETQIYRLTKQQESPITKRRALLGAYSDHPDPFLGADMYIRAQNSPMLETINITEAELRFFRNLVPICIYATALACLHECTDVTLPLAHGQSALNFRTIHPADYSKYTKDISVERHLVAVRRAQDIIVGAIITLLVIWRMGQLKSWRIYTTYAAFIGLTTDPFSGIGQRHRYRNRT